MRPGVLKSLVATPVADLSASVEKGAARSNESGMASITSSPDGADIFIDSIGRGKAPAIVELLAGRHSIQLVLAGFRDWTSNVEMKPGSVVNVTATFEKSGEAP